MARKRYSAENEARRVSTALEAHDRLDTERFDALSKTLEEIHKDVKSLLDSRAYARGAWWGIGSMATVVSAVVGFVVAWWKHS